MYWFRPVFWEILPVCDIQSTDLIAYWSTYVHNISQEEISHNTILISQKGYWDFWSRLRIPIPLRKSAMNGYDEVQIASNCFFLLTSAQR